MSATYAELVPINPGRDEAISLLHQGFSVPVYREILADLETPVSAYLKLSGDAPSFLLESAESADTIGRYSFVGANPYLIVSMRDGHAEFQREGKRHKEKFDNPLDLIERELCSRNVKANPDLPRFQGGAVGFLGHESVCYFENIPTTGQDDLGVPDSTMMFVDSFVIFDHYTRSLKLVSQAVADGHPEQSYDRAIKSIEQMQRILNTPLEIRSNKSRFVTSERTFDSLNQSQSQHEKAVLRAKEYIASGDVIQVVLSVRIARTLSVPAFDVYRFLRQVNPSPYMFFLDLGDMQIAGASPEMLVQVEGDGIKVRPIAGTRWRGCDAAEDDKLAAELLNDEKERAEHVMLVDLGRNDVGRVAIGGTVNVPTLMAVEKFSHVMHIVSEVAGTLAPDMRSVDALRSAFPAGTLSGAPKIRALEIIDELEPTRRGVYGGAVGYFSFTGDVDTAISIRTMLARHGHAFVQAGGGIVADSNPKYEFNECMNKAQAVIRAIEMAEEVGFDSSDR